MRHLNSYESLFSSTFSCLAWSIRPLLIVHNRLLLNLVRIGRGSEPSTQFLSFLVCHLVDVEGDFVAEFPRDLYRIKSVRYPISTARGKNGCNISYLFQGQPLCFRQVFDEDYNAEEWDEDED